MTPLAPGADAPPRAPQARPLSRGEARAATVVAVLVAALGVLGFINSFRAVARAAAGSFGALAPTVPLGIDLAIAVFSAMDLVLARLDMRPRWVRLVPQALTVATIYLNVDGQSTWFGRIAHAVFPALWVLAVSLAAHVIRVRAQLAAGTRIDRIRTSRWLLAPASTAALWRRMVLWEIRSYPDALARERARLLALTDLQDAYGAVSWRWKAPRRVRALYRLGDLAPAAALAPAPAGACTEPRTDALPEALTPGPSRTHATARTGLAARTEPEGRTRESAAVAPLEDAPRASVVEMVAGQIRDAIGVGEAWSPDYPELMRLTGRRRSWCEKVVRDARNLLLTPADDSPRGESRTDARPGHDRTDSAGGDRTGDQDRTEAPALTAA